MHDQATAGNDIQGERRELTVLALSLACAPLPPLAMELDDLEPFRDEAIRKLVDIIYTYEGTIDQCAEDGLIALFGAVMTHENDPERAVLAAIDMRSAMEALNQRALADGLQCSITVGLHTGKVVVGKTSNDLHVDLVPIEGTMLIPDRLRQCAEAGSILASPECYRRTATLFDFERLPDDRLMDGECYRLAVSRHAHGLSDSSGEPAVPLIGRADVLERLVGLFGDATPSHARVVVVNGEAGIGKSRLVQAFVATIPDGAARVVQAVCRAHTRERSLWIVASLLRSLLGVTDQDAAEAQLAALTSRLRDLDLLHGDTGLYLSSVLELTHCYPEGDRRLRFLDPVVLQRQTHAALRHYLLAETVSRPTILIVEDLHWIDPASRDFLQYLVPTALEHPLMLLLVVRDMERGTVIQPLLNSLQEFSRVCSRIELQPLTQAETEHLVDARLDGLAGFEWHKMQIARRVQGNPLYLNEIIRMLIDQGGLIEAGGTWRIGPNASTLLRELPGSLQQLMQARFERLPEHLRRTLQRAAVLGVSFPVSLLHGLDATSSSLAPAIDELEHRQILYRQPFGALPGLSFCHVLTQEAIYATLLEQDRRRLHGQAAHLVASEAALSREEQTALLAFHYAESATPQQAIPHLIAAATFAANRLANETALRYYRRAETLLLEAGGSETLLFAVRVGLGKTLKFIGDYAEAGQQLEMVASGFRATPDHAPLSLLIDALRELADLRTREGDFDAAITCLQQGLDQLDLAGAADADDTTGRWRQMLVERLGWVYFRQGRLDDAWQTVHSTLIGMEASAAEDLVTHAALLNTLGGIAWQRGDLAEAAGLVGQMLDTYRRLDYSWGMATAYTNLGVLRYSQGHWEQAATSLQQAYQIRHDNGYLPDQALNLKNLGMLRLALGDHDQARRDFERSLHISRQLGEGYGMVVAHLGLAQLAVLQPDYDDAEAQINLAMTSMAAAGDDEAIEARRLQAIVLAGRGRVEAAVEAADDAVRQAIAAELPDLQADSLRVVGMLHGRLQRWEDAARALHGALELSRELGDTYRQGQTFYELGRFYAQQACMTQPSDHLVERARQAYDQAIACFQPLGADFDLRLARRAVEELVSAVPCAGSRIPQMREQKIPSLRDVLDEMPAYTPSQTFAS